jgi:hypothetical protein
MLSRGYAILYQKGKRYVHRAIFYLNKEQVQDLKDGFLTDLLITRLLMLILYFSLHIFPFYVNFISILYLKSLEPRNRDRVLVFDEVFVDELDQVLNLVKVFFPEPTRSSISVKGFLKELKLVLVLVELFCLLVQQL